MAQAHSYARHQRPGFGVGDILAGVSVALMVIPQSLAYAEVAGMPAYTGLYAAALPTIVSAFFVSSPYLQTGPVALTSLLTLSALSPLATPGSPAYIGLAALLALIVGLGRVCIGLAKLGAVASLMSQPVLAGFASAAAFLIVTSQLPTAVGVSAPNGGVLLQAFWTLTHPHAWEPMAVALTGITIAIVLLGRRLHPLIPGVIIAMGFGIAVSHLTGYAGAVVGTIPTGLPHPDLTLPWKALPTLLVSGGIIALVGFSEAVAIARTYAMQERMPWDANQEFVSQGVANLVAGLFGGFPVGSSFSRSAINHLAGATSRWSGAITGLVVLASLPFTGVLSGLPKAVLGAIVIAAVSNLIRPRQLLELWRYSHPQATIAWLTFGLTLGLAPRIDIAVLIGIGLAVAQHLRREQQLTFKHWVDDDLQTLHCKPLGVLWFGSAPLLEEEFTFLLAEYPDMRAVRWHLGGLGRIDLSAAMVLQKLTANAQHAGLDVELLEVPPMAKSWIARVWHSGVTGSEAEFP
jgi:sulfate permease, SulP family